MEWAVMDDALIDAINRHRTRQGAVPITLGVPGSGCGSRTGSGNGTGEGTGYGGGYGRGHGTGNGSGDGTGDGSGNGAGGGQPLLDSHTQTGDT